MLSSAGGLVHLSFFGLPSLGRVAEPLIASAHGLKIASLIDLAGMKAAVVQQRAEAKDYIDTDALLRHSGLDLPTALAAASEIYGPQFNAQLTLKALCYFADGNVSSVPQQVKDRLVRAVAAVDLNHLPSLKPVWKWVPEPPGYRR